jgi:hypothetical protein
MIPSGSRGWRVNARLSGRELERDGVREGACERETERLRTDLVLLARIGSMAAQALLLQIACHLGLDGLLDISKQARSPGYLKVHVSLENV